MSTGEMTHIDTFGRLKMVDVSEKARTWREARAEAFVSLSKETLRRICSGDVPKGNVLEAARLAGIMAAKKTWELIPLCHQLQLTGVEVDFCPDELKGEIRICSSVKTNDRTGVEMEALVAATIAALTIYDMCKAIDREITLHDARLTFKAGGKSGVYSRG
jgi:cyclic pyranopterin phosphate synthase